MGFSGVEAHIANQERGYGGDVKHMSELWF